jgi:hypothetical protein
VPLEAIEQLGVRSEVEALAVIQETVSPEAVPHDEGIFVIVHVSKQEASAVAEEYIFAMQEAADPYSRVERSIIADPNTPDKEVKGFLMGRKQLSPAIPVELTPVDADYYTPEAWKVPLDEENTDVGT